MKMTDNRPETHNFLVYVFQFHHFYFHCYHGLQQSAKQSHL